jgi:hypothetical protein
MGLETAVIALAFMCGIAVLGAAIPWTICAWDRFVRGKEPLLLPLRKRN